MTEVDWETWLRTELKALGIVAVGLPMMATKLKVKMDSEIDKAVELIW